MFFSKAFGGSSSEFFEKSIDKHKIDAILNSTVRFGRSDATVDGLVLSVFPMGCMGDDRTNTKPSKPSGVELPHEAGRRRVVAF